MVLIQDYTIKTPDVLSMLNPPKYAGLFAPGLFILYRQRVVLITCAAHKVLFTINAGKYDFWIYGDLLYPYPLPG